MEREPWLQIWKVNRGFLVRRGCQSLVFRNDEREQMKEAFGDLLENEDKAGQKWCEGLDGRIALNTLPTPSDYNLRA